MDLGQFSVSLSVKDMDKSLSFYEALGFEVIDGGHMHTEFHKDTETTKWRIMKNGETVIGLFMGMFPNNILTFNPKDVRSVQKNLKEKGLAFSLEAKPGEGPAHAALTDPDGNQVLLDQH